MTESPTPTTSGGPGSLAGRPVARIGYGAMQLERLSGDRDAAVRLVRHAVDHGVDHIDTAQFYGDGFVNEVLRRAVPVEAPVAVVTKVGADAAPGERPPLRAAQRPAELRASVEDNLRALGRERLDLVYLRRMDAGPGLRATAEQQVALDDQLATMTALRDEGKIAAIGISATGIENLRAAVPAGIAAVQNAYNVLLRDDEDLLRLCEAEGIAWVPFFPLGSAFAGRRRVADHPEVRRIAAEQGVTPGQVGLAWQLQHSPSTLLVPGTASLAHLDENLAAGEVVLTADAVAVLDGLG